MVKNIKIDDETWKELSKQKIEQGLKKIADVINTNINFRKKFDNEEQFHNWFKQNYKRLGFQKIITERIKNQGSPDFTLLFNNIEINVELETLSSHYNHNDNDVDLVICLKEDKKLNVPTIEVSPFEYIGKEMFNAPLFIKLPDEKKHQFKVKCSENGLNMNDVIEQVVSYFIKHGKKSSFIKT